MAEKQTNFLNILDYIENRSDLSFEQSPFNTVDALIFCQLSYLHLDSIVPSTFDGSVTLSAASEMFINASDYETRKDLGSLINPLTEALLLKCAGSNRFGNVKMCAFIDKWSRESEEQFSAVTFLFDEKQGFSKAGKAFAAFRGTDSTLIGWKEDFNLAFMQGVPAQKDAQAYLKEAMEAKSLRKRDFYSGGHSKGGNLALFAAASQDEKLKKRLVNVFNFDGPGFSEKDLLSSSFLSVMPKIISVYPQMSLIGMLFHHYEGFIVAESSEKLIMQHDPFSWRIKGCRFVELPSLENGSEIFFNSFNKWFEGLNRQQRENFVETVFSLLKATKAKTVTDLSRTPVRNAEIILKSAVKLDPSIRDEALKIIFEFLKVTKNEITGKNANSSVTIS